LRAVSAATQFLQHRHRVIPPPSYEGAAPSYGAEGEGLTDDFEDHDLKSVPANELIRRTIKSQEEDPRMPAILEDDAWSTWLGEGDATPATAKAVLRTMEGLNRQTAPQPKKPRPRKP
jgi:hypothetical protein